jgi:serine protease AprX
MKKIILLLILTSLFLSDASEAAPAYAFRVRFKDKIGSLTIADSNQFLSPKALLRRSKQGILLDSTDLPLVQAYIDSVFSVGGIIKIHNRSKWFNQIVIITADSTKAIAIQNLPMVASVKMVAYYSNGIYKTDQNGNEKFGVEHADISSAISKSTRGNSAFYGNAFQQIDMIEGDCLHDLGYKGEGMNIAVFDTGFKGVDSCNILASMFTDGRMKYQYDFARDTANAFTKNETFAHAINVLACLASDMPGTFVGTAPKANYYLYTTEDTRFEMPIEEDNWLSAAEHCDSMGVDMINGSLGYNLYTSPFVPYTYADMDGKTTMIAKAANMTVAKGIFVVVAMGNEGLSAWHYMLTPADADSVYSVGSVDGSGIWSGSSYGPNYLGVVKPDGVALGKGTTILNAACAVGSSNGSSYSSPVLCGAIACLWQALPQLTNWQLRQLVKMSSSLYTTPNYTIGYGLPNLCNARNIALGIGDVQQIDYSFSLFPNPTNGILVLKSYIGSIDNLQYQLYDVAGKLIYSSPKLKGNEFEINALQSQAAGTYVLSIMANGKSFQTKITRQ